MRIVWPVTGTAFVEERLGQCSVIGCRADAYSRGEERYVVDGLALVCTFRLCADHVTARPGIAVRRV